MNQPMMNCTIWALLGALCALSPAHAELRLAAYAIPGVFAVDKSGDYDKVMARISATSDLKFNYAAIAPDQLEADFKAGKLDCVIPLDARFWAEPGKFFNSVPLNVAKIYIFSRNDVGPYTSFSQLRGKKVGARQGMPYGPKYEAAELNAELAENDNANVVKLAAGTIDAFVAYVPDMWSWASTKRQPLPNHDRNNPADVHRDAFLCRDTPAAHQFMNAFDAAVIKLRDAGELKQILGRSFVP